MRWGAFAAEATDLASIGRNRLLTPPAYMATVRADGRPRVHPVTPVLTDDGLFVFMEPNSPKGSDIRERRVYSMHCRVDDISGGAGEFWLAGEGVEIVDATIRRLAASHASYQPADRYILFALGVDEARSVRYKADGREILRWRAS